MPKLLLIGSFDGADVGEAWVAFQWVRRLASRHDVTVLSYHKRGKNPLSQQLPGVRVVEWQDLPFVGRAERLNSMLKPGYAYFYVQARKWIKARRAAGESFELAFQPVPVAMRYPSPVAGLGIPYMIGPVGGSLPSPEGFQSGQDTAPWYVGLRGIDGVRMRCDPLLRKTYEQASCVLGIAPYVRDFLDEIPLRRFELMSETGIEALPDRVDRTARSSGPVRLLFVGRLIRTKGARDAIQALSLLPDLPVQFDIVGDGFDRTECESMVARLGLGDKVRFHGYVERRLVDDFYRQADIFLFPSYREPGGNVVFEAMGFGLPLIVSDNGGPGAVVDDASGIRLHPTAPEQYAQDIAGAIEALVRDSARRLTMGEAARGRVQEVALWDKKVERFEEICAEILASSARVRD